MHDFGVLYIAVGKSDQVDGIFPDQPGEVFFRVDGDAIGISVSGQLRRVPAAVDVRDLGRGKSDDAIAGVVFEINVEIVKIPAGRPHDDYFLDHIFTLSKLSGIKVTLIIYHRIIDLQSSFTNRMFKDSGFRGSKVLVNAED